MSKIFSKASPIEGNGLFGEKKHPVDAPLIMINLDQTNRVSSDEAERSQPSRKLGVCYYVKGPEGIFRNLLENFESMKFLINSDGFEQCIKATKTVSSRMFAE